MAERKSPSTSPKWNTIWHKAKAQKEAAFLYSVIHKALVVNEWRSKISTKIDQSCPHCGPWSVESVEHKFYNCPLAQHGQRYATNIIWQLKILFLKKSACASHFPYCNVFLINLCVKHLNNSVISGSSWEALLCGSYGSNGMIWFLIVCNGPLRKHVKPFGMPCKIMGGLNGNGRSSA